MFNAQAKLGNNPNQNHFLGSFTSLNRIFEVFNLTHGLDETTQCCPLQHQVSREKVVSKLLSFPAIF
jgi:hypothetical protein